MITLIHAVLLGGLALLALSLLGSTCWWLYLTWVDHIIQSQPRQPWSGWGPPPAVPPSAHQQPSPLPQPLLGQGLQVVDLGGQRRWLNTDEIEPFRQACLAELEFIGPGLRPSASWSEIRSHWRLRSLQWHPDHGGDNELWLRKQRAYNGLRTLQGDA